MIVDFFCFMGVLSLFSVPFLWCCAVSFEKDAKAAKKALLAWRSAERYGEKYAHLEEARDDVAQAWHDAIAEREIAFKRLGIES